ncbi:hypothetical protein M422DRAFT_776188 [Sphaerobolus stellatus SS14]|nr:hypothetical protein M422DRAFT_776188 [Sphaerobolus stellatus SS14]
MGFTIIKYEEGYIFIPATGQIVAKPYEFWTLAHQKAYGALAAFWGISWCLEAVSHNEELCFWLYLLHAGPTPVPWFKSIYFRCWVIASIVASVIILTALGVTHDDPLKMEAWSQFAGSFIGLLNTLGFLPVLYVFPNFIRDVKNEGGDMAAVVRLAKFYDLNVIRIIFRFFFVVPVLILSLDGIKPHTHPINESLISTDLLAVLSGIACIVQSAITLMIFFPRNVETETKRWLESRSNSQSQSRVPRLFSRGEPDESAYEREGHGRLGSHDGERNTKFLLTDSPVDKSKALPILPSSAAPPYTAYSPPQAQRWYDSETPGVSSATAQTAPHVGNQLGLSTAYDGPISSYPPVSFNNTKKLGNGRRQLIVRSTELTEANMKMYQETVPKVNPLALYFRSPLDFDDDPRAGHTFGRI